MNESDNLKQKCDFNRFCDTRYACSYNFYSVQSSCTILHLAYLFIPTQTRIIWKHSAMQKLVPEDTQMFPTLSVAGYSFIQLSELGCRGNNENAKASRRQQ